ncbi:hypothetical protein BIY45_09190 [Stenotrophomonas sp. BIIR7]|nr:hypothetical protein BIY45_09190 [Stenotrophomonas sp. BIIR7]
MFETIGLGQEGDALRQRRQLAAGVTRGQDHLRLGQVACHGFGQFNSRYAVRHLNVTEDDIEIAMKPDQLLGASAVLCQDDVNAMVRQCITNQIAQVQLVFNQ